jgi:alpha-aminoadipate carrier protein LysW
MKRYYGGKKDAKRNLPDVQVDEDTDKGDVVECDDCGTQLEVVGLDPIELDIAVEDEEDDWDDE